MEPCTDCVLHKKSKCNNLPGHGSMSSGVMLLGEAPGAEEEREGKPFVGQSGNVLDRVLSDIGVDRSTLFISNAVRCRPPKNREPKVPEIKACRKHLEEEVERLKPRVIVPLGNSAFKAVAKGGSIGKYRGQQLVSTIGSHSFMAIPTYHPAAILRDWSLYNHLRNDIQKAIVVASDPNFKVPSFEGCKYEVYHTPELVKKLLDWIRETYTDYITFDLETNGLDYRTKEILCISLSHMEKGGFVIPLIGKELRRLRSDESQRELLAILKEFFESGLPFVAQNGTFDRLFLREALGIKVDKFSICTMHLHHLVDEAKDHSLEFLISAYTDMPAYKDMVLDSLPPKFRGKKTLDYSKAPENLLWEYAAADADATYRVARRLKEQAIKDNVWELNRDLMLPLGAVLDEMELDGVLVDVAKIDKLQVEADIEVEKKTQEIYSLAGTEFNINSHPQKATILFDKLKYPVIKKTDTGLRSTDKDVLEELMARGHTLAGCILELSNIKHDMNLYLKGDKDDDDTGLDRFIKEDGRIHPNWKAYGARTGRLSCVKPNLHSIKKDGALRSIFIAPEKCYWMMADYSQAELRVLAHLAQDTGMLSLFREGADMHAHLASKVFDKDIAEVTDKERSAAKTLGFGMIYGMTSYGVHNKLGCTEAEAEVYIDSYFGALPAVKRWFSEIKQTAEEVGEVVSEFGRRRRVPQISRIVSSMGRDSWAAKRIFRQCTNFRVQSPTSDILSKATIRIHARLKDMKTRLLLTHHDALNMEVPEDEIEEAIKIMVEEMTRPVPEMDGLRLPIEMEIGRFWGDKSHNNLVPEGEFILKK